MTKNCKTMIKIMWYSKKKEATRLKSPMRMNGLPKFVLTDIYMKV